MGREKLPASPPGPLPVFDAPRSSMLLDAALAVAFLVTIGLIYRAYWFSGPYGGAFGPDECFVINPILILFFGAACVWFMLSLGLAADWDRLTIAGRRVRLPVAAARFLWLCATALWVSHPGSDTLRVVSARRTFRSRLQPWAVSVLRLPDKSLVWHAEDLPAETPDLRLKPALRPVWLSPPGTDKFFRDGWVFVIKPSSVLYKQRPWIVPGASERYVAITYDSAGREGILAGRPSFHISPTGDLKLLKISDGIYFYGRRNEYYGPFRPR